jgi:hypothetical protein
MVLRIYANALIRLDLLPSPKKKIPPLKCVWGTFVLNYLTSYNRSSILYDPLIFMSDTLAIPFLGIVIKNRYGDVIMSTIMDLSVLSCAGVSADLCSELGQGKFEIKASKEEAIVFGSDGARVFHVTTNGVDQALMKAIFEKNAPLQQWVGECRTTARESHGNCNVMKDYDAGTALLAFRGDNGKVRVKIEKRHETEKGKFEKHAAYTPFASVNSALYRACCISMEQFKGPQLDAKGLEFVQLAPQLRFDEKSKVHVPTPAKEVVKPWSDKIVYKEPKVEVIAPQDHKSHKHHHKHK